MSSAPSFATPFLPLDEEVWQAWLAKNRQEQEVYFARRLKVTIFLAPVVAVILSWLFLR